MFSLSRHKINYVTSWENYKSKSCLMYFVPVFLKIVCDILYLHMTTNIAIIICHYVFDVV